MRPADRGASGSRDHGGGFTFDDGPSQWTEPILDALRSADARATCFVIGDAIHGKEGTLGRMVDEGHEVANYTATHARLDRLPARTDIDRELRVWQPTPSTN